MKTKFSNQSLAMDGILISNNSTEESSGTTLYVTVAQAAISFIFLVFSSCANGLLLFLLARFKKLQTISNILVADLAIIDLLNIIINGPMFVCYAVLNLDAFRGKLTAWIVSTCHVLLCYLTLTTMFLMMIDRFLAIRFPLHYKVLKTKKKVILAIIIKWLASFIAVLCVYVPLRKIDLGKRSVLEYRATYSRKSNSIIPRAFSPPILLGSICLYLLSRKTLRSSLRQFDTANGLLRSLHTGSQKRNRKAINTILIVIVVFCVSYLPEILRSARPLGLSGSARQWLVFVFSLILFLPVMFNPFIYFTRVELFRSSLTELMERREGGTTEHQLQLNRRRASLGRVRNLLPSGEEVGQISSSRSARDTKYRGKDRGTAIRRNQVASCSREIELHARRNPAMNLSRRHSI